jgi:hypothetical protein
MPSPAPSFPLTSAPQTAEGRALRARLARRDRDDWPWLLEGLREIARGLAPAYRDVCSADDLLGELALRTHERWLEEWLAGAGEVSLGIFLRDRLRDHLRDLRRRAERRGALLGGAVPGNALVETDAGARGALLASAAPSPERALEVRELQRELGPESATLLGLRAAGYEHAEIATQTGLSRQTVGRRLGALVAVLVTLGAASALLLATRSEPIVAIDAEPNAAGAAATNTLDADVPTDTTPLDPLEAGPTDASRVSSEASRVSSEASRASTDASLDPLDAASNEPLDGASEEDTGKPADALPGEPEDGLEREDWPGLRVPAALAPQPSRRLPTTAEASTPQFLSARAERLRAVLALCRREAGGSVRLELMPGEPEDVGVDRVDRACVTHAVRREMDRGRPDTAQTLRFEVDEELGVHTSTASARARR